MRHNDKRARKFEILLNSGKKLTIRDFEDKKEQRAYHAWLSRKRAKGELPKITRKNRKQAPVQTLLPIPRAKMDLTLFFPNWNKYSECEKEFLTAGYLAAVGDGEGHINTSIWKKLADIHFSEMRERKEQIHADDYKVIWEKIVNNPVKPEDCKILEREEK